jgi:hypothetical protein
MDILAWMIWIMVAILSLHILISSRKRSPVSELTDHYQGWMRSCRARGLSPAQMDDEFRFRTRWVSLRRRASISALQAPCNYRPRLDAIAREEATLLAAVDKKLAKKFLQIYDASPLEDILYPDAIAAVKAGVCKPRKVTPTEDHIASIRTHR